MYVNYPLRVYIHISVNVYTKIQKLFTTQIAYMLCKEYCKIRAYRPSIVVDQCKACDNTKKTLPPSILVLTIDI